MIKARVFILRFTGNFLEKLLSGGRNKNKNKRLKILGLGI